MFLADPDRRLVISPSDLRLASECEFALVRELDVLLGRAAALPVEPDGMRERVAQLGDAHEQRELRRLSREHPGRVRQFPRPAYDLASLTAAAGQTLDALRDPGVEVVVQGTFFDGGFVGHADFLQRTDDGWLVSDTKLARSASVPALLQIAAYAAALRSAGVPTSPVARLVLGSGSSTDHALDDILPVYRARRTRLDDVLAAHRADESAARWTDPRWLACGRCDACAAQAEAAHDVLLVAGVRMPQRRRLLEAGVGTVEDLAQRTEPVLGVRPSSLERLRAQARLQLVQDLDPAGRVVSEVSSVEPLRAMPTPSQGDVFFDFEADPLWAEPGSSEWGLEYLFGFVEVDGAPPGSGNPEGAPRFRTLWAHDRDAERQALVDFVGYLTERRRRWPDLHVYHYAAYERTALLRLAARHGVCEDEIDQFLREGVFVDLYAVVRAGIRVSQRSYSLKKLEPLYMVAREGDVQLAADSIVVYHQFVEASESGDLASAEALLRQIADYNHDDCVSTMLLRDWLLAQAHAEGAAAARGGQDAHPPADGAAVATPLPELREPDQPSPKRLAAIALEEALRSGLHGVKAHERTPEQQAVALIAATLQFHAREAKPFWWGHFDRLRTPVAEWLAEPGALAVTRGRQDGEWRKKTPRQRVPRRDLTLVGEPLGGTPIAAGAKVAAVYGQPCPQGVPIQQGQLHGASPSTVQVLAAGEVTDAGSGHPEQVVTLEELRPSDGCEHTDLPVALVPIDVVRADQIEAALAELGTEMLTSLPALPVRPGIDLLLRRAPRLHAGGALPEVGVGADRHVTALTAAVLDLDHSALAVQGPPGTGKTHVGSRVIARLVRDHGWRVGVCAQSHAAVENVLTAVVDAGLDPALVAKHAVATEDPTWTALRSADGLAGFAAGRPGGYVLGGTAWDLCNLGRVERGQLDLLVVDEAGQFSLANTVAVSVAAQRLLLLGDPQQLPQVSKGTHAEPVGHSALGWLIGDEPVLPPELGYFLETTWRMHPALTEPVSRLSYAGQLGSASEVTTARALAGIDAGLHVRLVDHHDNATSSAEEAEVVLCLVRDLLGRAWRPAADRPSRPLDQDDLCVITPYNAQVAVLRAALAGAGFDAVPVGTVDTFQGREAAVAIVSMAASAHADVSRGIGFLLDRHRLNVAISRAQWAAYLVRSEVLTDFAPRSPAELTALGAFLGLCERAVSTRDGPAAGTG